MGKKYKSDDLECTYYGNNLVATIKDTQESLTFRDRYANEFNVVDGVELTDGSLLTGTELDQLTKVKMGTDNDDVLRGGNTKDEIIYGKAGNDMLYDNYGNDQLYGGSGQDMLYDGYGDDRLRRSRL